MTCPKRLAPLALRYLTGGGPQKKFPRPIAFSFVISLHKLQSHFKNEGIFRFGPPRIKKKSAEGAEDAEAPQAPGGDVFYGPKINLATFRKFWDFFAIYIF